MQITKANDQVT